jgi:hypothetical protein
VERRFTLERMAQTLAAVYRTAATPDLAAVKIRGVAA